MSDDMNKNQGDNKNQPDQQQGNVVDDPLKAMAILGYKNIDIGGQTIDLEAIMGDQSQQQNIHQDNIGTGGQQAQSNQANQQNQNTGGDPAAGMNGNQGASKDAQQAQLGDDASTAKDGSSAASPDNNSDKEPGFFDADIWKSFVPQQQQNSNQQTNQPQDTSQKSSFVDKNNNVVTIADVAKELGVEYDPTEALDPSSDSHKVYVEFQRRLLQSAVLQAQQLQDKQLQQQRQEELVKRKVQKLVEKYPDMRAPNGGVDESKLSAMLNFIQSLEGSEDGLVILREFVDFMTLKKLGAAAKKQNQQSNNNNSQQPNINQQQQQIVLDQVKPNGVNGHGYQAVIDSQTVQEFQRLFGGK